MSDERREQAWQAWSRGGGPSPETIRRVGLMYMFRGAFDSGYDARNAEVEALRAALRTARASLAAVPRGESWLHLGDDVLASLERIRDDRVAEIDAVLDAS